MKQKQSPNASLDRAFENLMRDMENDKALNAVDKAKVLSTFVNWEKVKHAIAEQDPFDPESILGDDGGNE